MESVVDPPVAVVHLIGAHPVGTGDYLMPQANPKQGLSGINDVPGRGHGILQRLRVPGPVG